MNTKEGRERITGLFGRRVKYNPSKDEDWQTGIVCGYGPCPWQEKDGDWVVIQDDQTKERVNTLEIEELY